MALQMRFMIREVLALVLSLLLCFSCSPSPVSDAIWYPVSVKKLPIHVKVHADTTRTGMPKYWIKYRGNTIYLSEANKLLLEKQAEPFYVIKNRHIVKNITRYSVVPSSKLKSDEDK